MKFSRVQLFLTAVWIGFVVYAFGFAPPEGADTFKLIESLIRLEGNPALVAVFNLMGLVPLLYWFLLIPDSHGQKLPAWPFGLGMLAVGAFALLPYLILRRPHDDWPDRKTGWAVRVFDSRWLALPVVLGILGLIVWGIGAGDWDAYWEQWRTVRFVHVMTLDFVLLSLLLPFLLADDMRRRGLNSVQQFWAVSLLPLLGTMVYVLVRPSLRR